MSEKSNNQVRAYEFSYLTALFEEISKVRPAKKKTVVFML